MLTPVAFLPIDCQQSGVYTLVLCVRMPCRGGKARLALVQGLLVVGAGSKDRAACWLAPTLSKAPCCLQRSTIGLHPDNLTKASSWSRKLRPKLLFSAASTHYCDHGTKPVLVNFCPNHSLCPGSFRQWPTLAAAETLSELVLLLLSTQTLILIKCKMGLMVRPVLCRSDSCRLQGLILPWPRRLELVGRWLNLPA